MTEYYTRMGDGKRVTMTKEQIMNDLQAGTADAADMAGIPSLNANELEHIAEIIMCQDRVVGVAPGNEVILSYDIGQLDFTGDNGNSGNGVDMGRLEAALLHERALGADTFELAHSDYSIKPVKPVISMEMQTMEEIQAEVVAPFFYGAMPNQGLYYAPDGPYGNPADLMREFKIEESMQQSELASAHVTRDIEYVATRLQAAGSDGFNFDTTGSAGDADCVGTLNGVKLLREQCPEAYIQVGFAGESIMGIHGSIEFEGQVVAGMYPHQYVHIAEQAGANVVGTVVNTNTSKSLAFNIARAVTFIKESVKTSNIPVHADMGMGVGGIPMCETPPIDAVSRASKAMVEIAGVDGIQVGVGDPAGMDLPHFLTSGMGGIRSAGDLVARMEFGKNMRVKDAKAYVAKKLGLDVLDIVDEYVMRDLREELGIGVVTGVPGATRGIAAKMNIENLLDIKINSCEKFRQKMKR